MQHNDIKLNIIFFDVYCTIQQVDNLKIKDL